MPPGSNVLPRPCPQAMSFSVSLLEEPAKDVPWKVGLEQEPLVQAALLCIEAETGLVKVMVGGTGFHPKQVQPRDPVPAPAGFRFQTNHLCRGLDKGYTPASVLIDSPIVFRDKIRNKVWKPRNYGKRFYGPTLLRVALAKSRNVVTIKLLRDIGIKYAISYARKMGITAPLSPDLASGPGVLRGFPAGTGQRLFGFCQPGVPGRTNLYHAHRGPGRPGAGRKPPGTRAGHREKHRLHHDQPAGKCGQGGHRAPHQGSWPAGAGKTGTTNDLYDAWFVGYTPRYITGTWVGLRREAPLGEGETGSRAASPIWLGFMQRFWKESRSAPSKCPRGWCFPRSMPDRPAAHSPIGKNPVRMLQGGNGAHRAHPSTGCRFRLGKLLQDGFVKAACGFFTYTFTSASFRLRARLRPRAFLMIRPIRKAGRTPQEGMRPVDDLFSARCPCAVGRPTRRPCPGSGCEAVSPRYRSGYRSRRRCR
jgi:hypothetical protein